MKTTSFTQIVTREFSSAPQKVTKKSQARHPKALFYPKPFYPKPFIMNNLDQYSDPSLASRRVSLDMSQHGGAAPMHPGVGHKGNYGPPPPQGYNNGFAPHSMEAILPIPPVGYGGGAPRSRMPFARRQSAPGFYSRQDPLAPAMQSPHMPGAMYMPMASNMRRGSLMGSMSSHLQHQQQQQDFMNAPAPQSFHLPVAPNHTYDRRPVDPFADLPSSSMPRPQQQLSSTHLSAELDATINEVVAATSDAELARTYSNNMGVVPEGTAAAKPAKLTTKRPQSIVSFPTKLYEILMDAKYVDFVTWLPHGRAWRILKQKSFEKEVIPKHFRSARYASFMRQVNGWGFKRITEGPDLNAYYHESFLRGLPELVAEMRRPQKGELPVRKPRGYPENPDFYKISAIAPLPCSSPSQRPGNQGVDTPGSTQTPSLQTLSSPATVDELAVISERSESKRFQNRHPSPAHHKKATTNDHDAAMFFGEVSSVGSWMEHGEQWEDHQRTLSPLPENAKSNFLRNSSPSIPRELKIHHHYQMEHSEDDVLSKADLAYLAQQNRLLLRQAQMNQAGN